ncbi:S-layer homology domain-containing protein [Paenibacillus sp. D2_2]|uniref:S-layer homology domain-containing protein n=1 Tax=Paenibacillus sp. D2_2 TaxID=3073092 RepID=UPI0028157001|nr:S-layer homology domain-containing protein [Paenibacillus sp. D2_2]WMT41193.1 S-layer homology domain-containing protein [Paenibacillus sp. D2_2]
MHRAGILNGTGDDNFKPDQKITRAEMAAILARLLNMSAANGTKFSDINGNWAAEYINQLSQAGIVNGSGANLPSPIQSAAIIIRMLNIVLDLGLNL